MADRIEYWRLTGLIKVSLVPAFLALYYEFFFVNLKKFVIFLFIVQLSLMEDLSKENIFNY